MIRKTQEVLSNFDKKSAQEVEIYKQNIDDLIFKARNKHIQNIQYGKLPMEFDYMILNLFTDLDRTTEHCMNVVRMLLRKENNESKTEFVYAW
jgi:Na+/phosphate symporter